MTAQDISDRRDGTDDHGPEHVIVDVGIGGIVTSDHGNEAGAQQKDHCGIDQGGSQPGIETEGKCLSRMMRVFSPQGT